jgi:hypothetical protein
VDEWPTNVGANVVSPFDSPVIFVHRVLSSFLDDTDEPMDGGLEGRGDAVVGVFEFCKADFGSGVLREGATSGVGLIMEEVGFNAVGVGLIGVRVGLIGVGVIAV